MQTTLIDEERYNIDMLILVLIPFSLCCPFPLLYEYITPFDIQCEDAKLLALNQFSSDTLSSYTAHHISISSIGYKTTNDPSHRSVVPAAPSSYYTVKNESLLFAITFQASVKSALKTHDYTGVFVVTVTVDYTKTIRRDGKIVFGVDTRIGGIGDISYHSPVSAEDQHNINSTVIQGNQSIITMLGRATTGNAVGGYFRDNANAFKYNSTFGSAYQYQLGSTTSFTVDTSLLSLLPYSSGMSYGMSGVMAASDACSSIVPSMPYRMFFTMQFISNMMGRLPKSITPTRETTIPFSFRAIDLQYVIPSVLDHFSFNEQIVVLCTVLGRTIRGSTEEGRLMVESEWECKGSIFNTLVLNFTLLLEHQVAFEVVGRGTLEHEHKESKDHDRLGTQPTLGASITTIRVVKSVYYEVEEYRVVDEGMADNYLQESIKSFYGRTIGSGFILQKGSQRCIFSSEGLYIL